VLATSNAVVNPVLGSNTFTFASPPTVVNGTLYYVAMLADTAFTYNRTSTGPTGLSVAQSYGSGFPATPNWTVASTNILNGFIYTITITVTNAFLVSEALQDASVTYVYDSTVGHTDLYNLAQLPATVSSIVAITTRALMSKSDAGARSGELQLKSGGTTVTTTPLVLPSTWQWNYRTDTVDPNTSSAWTLANANAVQIGPVVQA